MKPECRHRLHQEKCQFLLHGWIKEMRNRIKKLLTAIFGNDFGPTFCRFDVSGRDAHEAYATTISRKMHGLVNSLRRLPALMDPELQGPLAVNLSIRRVS